MTEDDKNIVAPPLSPRAGGSLSALYEDMARDPDVTDGDLVVRAQLARYGEQVRAARKRKNMTQKQLSAAVGITQARISRIESGVMDEGPTFRTMARIERTLGVQAMSSEQDWMEELLVDPALFNLPDEEQCKVLEAAFARKEVVAAVHMTAPELVKPIGVRVVTAGAKQSQKDFEVVEIDDVSSSFPQGCIAIAGIVRETPVAAGFVSTLNSKKNFVVLRKNSKDRNFAVSVIAKPSSGL